MGSSNHTRFSTVKRRPFAVLWTIVMWILGMIDWYHPQRYEEELHDQSAHIITIERSRSSCNRQFLTVTSILFNVILAIGSLWIFLWSIGYYRECQVNLMYTISFLIFYWPVIMSAPVICIIAAIKRKFKRNEWLRRSNVITWSRVFDESSFRGKMENLKYRNQSYTSCIFVFILFYSLASTSGLLETFWFLKRSQQCQTISSLIFLILHFANLLFYSTFCYFLYIQRKLLQNKCNIVVNYIEKNFHEVDRCAFKVKEFFKEYFQLRKMLFPWFNTIVFSNFFGITFYLTWIFHVIPPSDDLIPSNQTSIDSSSYGAIHFCNPECADQDTKRYFTSFFSILVMCEKSMMLLLAIVAVGGIDLKHQWDHFQLKMSLNLANTDSGLWKRLSDMTQQLHPDASADVIASYILPVIGLVAGVIGGQYIL